MTFEEYLQDIHAKNYTGTDDDMHDMFNTWLVGLTVDAIIAYAENWHKSELQSMRAKGANTTNSKYSKEQRSEWAKKGGKSSHKTAQNAI